MARASGILQHQKSKPASMYAAHHAYCRWQGSLGADVTALAAPDVNGGTNTAVNVHRKTNLKRRKMVNAPPAVADLVAISRRHPHP